MVMLIDVVKKRIKKRENCFLIDYQGSLLKKKLLLLFIRSQENSLTSLVYSLLIVIFKSKT